MRDLLRILHITYLHLMRFTHLFVKAIFKKGQNVRFAGTDKDFRWVSYIMIE